MIGAKFVVDGRAATIPVPAVVPVIVAGHDTAQTGLIKLLMPALPARRVAIDHATDQTTNLACTRGQRYANPTAQRHVGTTTAFAVITGAVFGAIKASVAAVEDHCATGRGLAAQEACCPPRPPDPALAAEAPAEVEVTDAAARVAAEDRALAATTHAIASGEAHDHEQQRHTADGGTHDDTHAGTTSNAASATSTASSIRRGLLCRLDKESTDLELLAACIFVPICTRSRTRTDCGGGRVLGLCVLLAPAQRLVVQ